MGIEEAFNKFADSYDHSRRRLIPCFDDFYGTVIERIPCPLQSAPRVMDLGAGTGLLSKFVLDAWPNAAFTLIDISEEMLKKARERFKDRSGKVRFVVSDYARAPLPGKYEVVVSALSIHHLTEPQKTELFKKVYRALEFDGVFINADQALGATPDIETCYRETWLKQIRANGVTDGELAVALERMKEDKMSTLDDQLLWLKEARFKEVNCWYKNDSFAVFGGRRKR